MELRIVIFLACVSVSVVFSTAAGIAAYLLFAKMTRKVTDTLTEVRQNTELRQWIDSMQTAADRAVAITESTKVKIAEFDPILERAHHDYRRRLVDIDSRMDQAAEKITTVAIDVRNTVAKPAFAVATFAAGMTRVIEQVEPEEQ
jgi:hypothetical protein